MLHKLDIKDRKILYELDINARQSFSEISKKVRLSKEVVNYRIKRLEKLGIVKGYYALINISRLGYMCNRFLIKLKNATPKKEQEIITNLDYRGSRILLPEIISKISNFDPNDEVTVKAAKGKIVLEKTNGDD